MVIRARPCAFSLFILSSTSFCRVFRSDSRRALPLPLCDHLSSFFFFFLLSLPTAPLLPRLRLRSLRGTLTRTLGRRVIRRGTCWRKQSPWVNTESDERVIVNWENRVRSLVISIVSDCRYLLSRRYSATTYLLPSSAIQFRERQSLRVHAPACVVYNLLHRIISVVK